MDSIIVETQTFSGVQLAAKALRAERDQWYSAPFPLSTQYALIEPRYMILGIFGYLCMVAWGYGRAAADAKPIITNGRWALRVYNSAQVLLSGYIAYLATITFLRKILTTGVVCQDMIPKITNANRQEVELETFCTWLFYISKWVDFADTFFIITRSKWRQLSFLHTFHHSTMIGLTWLAAYYFPCGYFVIAAQLNASVHFVMYFYYLLSSFPSLTPYLWWKKYITSIQLVQFILGFVCTGICGFRQYFGFVHGISTSYAIAFVFYTAILYALFSNFYNQNYKKKVQASKDV